MTTKPIDSDGLRFMEADFGTPRYDATIELRNRILRKPLGLDLFREDRTPEAEQRHFALWLDDLPIACAIIQQLTGDTAKLRQMCVATDWQRSGLGKRLIDRIEQVVRAEGIMRIELAARLPVTGFYQRLGFQPEGDPFIEVTIPHQKMVKDLRADRSVPPAAQSK
jgi:predicted GNAT family N-acyltransferase